MRICTWRMHLKTMFSELRVRGTEQVGEHEAYIVVGQREGKPPIRLYFDEQSGLLVRLVRFGETGAGMAADADRLRGLSRYEWSENSVSLDAGAAQWAIHDSGDRGEAEHSGG